MNSLWSSQRGKIAIIVSAIILISSLLVGLLSLILGSTFLAFLLYIILIFGLLRKIGTFVMYPGASFYTRSQIELQFSRDLSAKIVKCFNSLHRLGVCIAQGQRESYDDRINYRYSAHQHIKSVINMLSMFQGKLSTRKKELLDKYREMDAIIERKEDERLSIAELINRPKRIGFIQQEDKPFYAEKFAEIVRNIKVAVSVLESFAPPLGMFQLLKYRLFDESLYQIRFSYYNWQAQFNYQRFSVDTDDNQILQTAIIHSLKQDGNPPQEVTKTVLFCNPNGVFIQFFANNQYISNYLQMGYRVVLWNYRGYGQSTGSPSISIAHRDAYAVYRFYRQKDYDISIVHGYSIGGVAAVGLLQKISKNLHKNPTDKVEGLIIDRSFSSISQISVILGKVVSKFAKILFYSDNVDISVGFESVICKKLLIWDSIDEVIPDIASVKNGILQHKKQVKSAIQAIPYRKNQLNEEINDLPGVSVTSLIAKFQLALTMLLIRYKKVQMSEKQTNFVSQEQRQTSMSTSSGLDDSNFQPLLQALRIDGGGVQLFRDINELQSIRQTNPKRFGYICESYLLGLICFGSVFPLQVTAFDRTVTKKQTLDKISKLLKIISARCAIGESNQNIQELYDVKDESTQQFHKNFYYIFSKVAQMIESTSEAEERRYGSLLPTSNGHNNSITRAEFRVLNAFTKSTEPSQHLPS